MKTFITPEGRAGIDQLYGIQESIGSHLERMFFQSARRCTLEHGVGRASTLEGVDSRLQLNAQQRECDAAITFHAGRSVELALQLIYAFGADRIMGREYPSVNKSMIRKDRDGHGLHRLYKRILDELQGRDMKNAFEDAYQKSLNKGIVDILINDTVVGSHFKTVEDMPFRETASRAVMDGAEMTQDHADFRGLFSSEKPSDFVRMPLATFIQFTEKADVTYYEGDIEDKQGRKRRANMRMTDYSARDHEYMRPYAVAGVMFFARLSKKLVALAHQPWIWHEDLSVRWWSRRNYNIGKLLDAHMQQNFHRPVEFPEMIPPEEQHAKWTAFYRSDPAASVKRGYDLWRSKKHFAGKS